MASVTVRNLDPAVKAGLQARAARNGVSMESELRTILREAAGVMPVRDPSPQAREARVQRLLSFGRKPEEPFDLKALSDAISDGTE